MIIIKISAKTIIINYQKLIVILNFNSIRLIIINLSIYWYYCFELTVQMQIHSLIYYHIVFYCSYFFA